MVVVQLVERSLPSPRFESSHRQKLYIEHLFTVNRIEKTKKGTGGREWPFFKKKLGQSWPKF